MADRVRYQPPTQTLEHVLGSDPSVVRGYARAVDDRLTQGPIRLSDRDRLIRRGERLGLKRFDANLIIAAMEHRRREHPAMRLANTDTAPSKPHLPRWLGWTAALTVQVIIAAGVWWVLF